MQEDFKNTNMPLNEEKGLKLATVIGIKLRSM